LRPFGTQVHWYPLGSKSWLGEYLPSLRTRKIEQLLEEEAGLNLIGANGGPIPFDGWVEVQFQLTSGAQSSTPPPVPLFVARDDLEYPIIGYNVIEDVIKSSDEMGGESTESLREIMSSAFSEVKQESTTALVDLVRRAGVERLRMSRSGKDNCVGFLLEFYTNREANLRITCFISLRNAAAWCGLEQRCTIHKEMGKRNDLTKHSWPC